MGWATSYIADLKEGKTVKFRPRGHSMKGLIEPGQLVTVEPIQEHTTLEADDVVLCKVNGSQLLHKIGKIAGKEFFIVNNVGGENDWISANQIFGKCVLVE